MVGLLGFLERSSKGFILVTAALLLVPLAIVDYATGVEIRFFIFYWPPIALVCWFVGRNWGMAYVALSELAWLAANWTDQLALGHPHVLLWNSVVNLASFALLAVLIARVRDLVSREQTLARTDFMTGAANGRAFAETLNAEISRSQRAGTPLSLAYIDIDDFKLVNDRFGHGRGDELLRQVADTVRATVRAGDVVARLGGDELAVLLPATDESDAVVAVNRLRGALRALVAGGSWPISFSIGLVTCHAPACSPDELVARADGLMYEVKAGGKDGIRSEVLGSPRGSLASGRAAARP